ncbi:uncharacterized protein LOC100680106 [Nasonia vitripennis]|uniref:Uncharacterized protein n=1 Tax=Nasonia vitripennis TaxID=7425 RepID=A0A7M7GHT0_NASVI|nr:uncharacterized protein LOC100680106 [Nasonia vitripennis]
MYSKTIFVFLVSLAIAQGIGIGKSTDHAFEISPSTGQGVRQIILKGSELALAVIKAIVRLMLKLLVKIVRTRVVQLAFTSGLYVLVRALFVNMFDCRSKGNIATIRTCMVQAENFTDTHFSQEKRVMMSKAVQEALADYERYLESEPSETIQPVDIDERKDDLKIAVVSDPREVEEVPNEEDNETISYI